MEIFFSLFSRGVNYWGGGVNYSATSGIVVVFFKNRLKIKKKCYPQKRRFLWPFGLIFFHKKIIFFFKEFSFIFSFKTKLLFFLWPSPSFLFTKKWGLFHFFETIVVFRGIQHHQQNNSGIFFFQKSTKKLKKNVILKNVVFCGLLV